MAERTPLAGAEPVSAPNVGGDLLVMLNERNRNRNGIFRNNIMKQAEEERRKALEELRHAVNNKK
jgi:hypothetical protein